jgi:chromosome segregation protein
MAGVGRFQGRIKDRGNRVFMKVKRLELHGFKSFMDKTIVEFPGIVSVIVGPNGCGKSNIVDAFRWVLGEQSAKQLRGDSMSDVIFNGTPDRKAMGLAEVNLIMSSDNGPFTGQWAHCAEVQVTRRLYRSGESDYLINKQPCRLKDIHQLFMDTGLTSKAYAIIEQGRIGAFVEAKAEDRRVWIEEAAGITGYKSRKQTALRRMEQAQLNLERLSDILAEVESQMISLERQAKQAVRYKKYKEQARDLEMALLAGEYARLGEDLGDLSRRTQELAALESERQAVLAGLEASREERRLALHEGERKITAARETVFQDKENISRLENDIVLLGQRIEGLKKDEARILAEMDEARGKLTSLADEEKGLKGQLTRVENELTRIESQGRDREESLREGAAELHDLEVRLEDENTAHVEMMGEAARAHNRLEHLKEKRGETAERLTRLRSQEAEIARSLEEAEQTLADQTARRDELRATAARLGQELKQAKEELEAADKRWRGADETHRRTAADLDRLTSQLESLTGLIEAGQGAARGVRHLLSQVRPETPGLGGVVAELFEVPAELEAALAAVLGERLQFVLADDVATARRAIDRLKADDAGRSGFVIDAPAGGAQFDLNDPRVKPLLPLAGLKPGREDVGRRLLKDVYLADDLDTALEVWTKNAGTVTLVTPEGDVLFADGHLAGGARDKAAGQLLARQRQLADLKKAVEAKQNDLDRSAAALEAAADERARRLEAIDDSIRRKDALEDELQGAERDCFQGQQSLKLLQGKAEEQQRTTVELTARIESVDKELAALEQQSRNCTDRAQEMAVKIERLREEMGVKRDDVEARRQAVADHQVEFSALRHRQENLTGHLERVRTEHRDLTARLEVADRELTTARERQVDLTGRRQESQNRVAGLYRELEDKQALLKGAEDRQRQAEEELLQVETEIKDQQQAAAELRDRLTELRLKSSGLEAEQKAVADKAADKYHQDLARVVGDYLQPDMDLDQTREKLDKLVGRIERMADKINLSAIEEHQVLEERHQFLTKNRDDLIKAVEDLNQTIRRINRTSKVRFLETLEAVNKKLQEVFPMLFEGGQAELFLTDPQNPLESGLDVHFQPPGKKLKTMSLMSGGEKALTAVAVTFSLFLIRPAPFCLLDEVDAPLDEANLERFNALVQLLGQSAQVIMASHKRRTMEAADTLYGVTMDEPGVTRVLSLQLKDQGAEPIAA